MKSELTVNTVSETRITEILQSQNRPANLSGTEKW